MHSDYFNSKNEPVPSVTTVLKILYKDGLLEWSNIIGRRGISYTKFLEDRATFGSLVHELIESDIVGKDPAILGMDKYMNEAIDLVRKFKVVKEDLCISNPIKCFFIILILQALLICIIQDKRCCFRSQFF